jgi:acetyltransferase-like isoleucine patch superfamily enzyme
MEDPLVNRLIRYPSSVKSRLRRLRLRWLGADIGRGCWLQKISVPRNPWDVRLGEFVSLDLGVVLLSTGPKTDQPRIVIGANTYINRFTMFDAHRRIEIGERCMIGPYCYFTDGDHGHGRGEPVQGQAMETAEVTIARDVWIGAHVCVLKGVSIGEGAVVGAGAVVTRNVPAFAKVAGVPARPIGERK